jgi:hypothetical protein
MVQSNLLSFDSNDWTFRSTLDVSVDLDFPLINTNDVIFSLDLKNIKNDEISELIMKLETITTSSDY